MKIFLFLISLLISVALRAQVSSGAMFVGGSLGLASSYASQISLTENSFSLNPTVGYFLTPKIAVGAGVRYIRSTSTENDFNHFHSVSQLYYFNLFIRTYFPLTDKLYFTVHTELSIGGGPANTDVYNQAADQELHIAHVLSAGLTIRPMVIFFPSPHWSIEAGLGKLAYSYTRNTDSNDYRTYLSAVNLVAGQVTMGVAWYFRHPANPVK